MGSPGIPESKRQELFKFFCHKQNEQYVSDQGKVSRNTVAKYREIDKWDERLDVIRKKAQEKADDKAARNLAKRVGAYRGLESAGLNYQTGKVRDDKAKLTVKEIIALGRQADLLEGLPDSRPDNSSLGEMDVGGSKLKDILRIAKDYLQEGKDDEEKSED